MFRDVWTGKAADDSYGEGSWFSWLSTSRLCARRWQCSERREREEAGGHAQSGWSRALPTASGTWKLILEHQRSTYLRTEATPPPREQGPLAANATTLTLDSMGVQSIDQPTPPPCCSVPASSWPFLCDEFLCSPRMLPFRPVSAFPCPMS
jgi:hypothetical protein